MSRSLRVSLALLVLLAGAFLSLGLEQIGLNALVSQFAVAPLVLASFWSLFRFERCLACCKLLRRPA